MSLKTFLSGIIILLSLASLPASAQKHAQSLQGMNSEILRLVNVHRAEIGRRPLTENPSITKAAEKHSRDMAAGRVAFGHDGFDDRVGRLMKEIKHANASAENVAYGSRTAKEVVEMWLHSAGHRKNIEGDYSLTGIGIAENKDGTLYFTQIFIKN